MEQIGGSQVTIKHAQGQARQDGSRRSFHALSMNEWIVLHMQQKCHGTIWLDVDLTRDPLIIGWVHDWETRGQATAAWPHAAGPFRQDPGDLGGSIQTSHINSDKSHRDAACSTNRCQSETAMKEWSFQETALSSRTKVISVFPTANEHMKPCFSF